jgi:hypothetical protein
MARHVTLRCPPSMELGSWLQKLGRLRAITTGGTRSPPVALDRDEASAGCHGGRNRSVLADFDVSWLILALGQRPRLIARNVIDVTFDKNGGLPLFLWEQRRRDGLIIVLLSDAMVHRDRNRRHVMPERNEIRVLTDEALNAVAGGWAVFVAAALQNQSNTQSPNPCGWSPSQREELYSSRV